MIKRTLLFGRPAYLSTKNEQLVVRYPDDDLPEKQVPIEDIGYLVLEDPQITISNRLMEKLLMNGAAVVHCDQRHMPIGLMMPLVGHSEQGERFRHQISASVPLKKNLWQQTVKAKIQNQASVLRSRNIPADNMAHWAKEVTSGDSGYHESRAAAYYWSKVTGIQDFTRNAKGDPPNALLNYGYAILRAVAARALVSSGMLPTLGIFHSNKYNAYALADDVMEPYRPMVDLLVLELVDSDADLEDLTPAVKQHLLQLPAIDVRLGGKKGPLMNAMSRTTHSLFECFAGLSRKLLYPEVVL
jgi:CRISPR-associated protein Cas1